LTIFKLEPGDVVHVVDPHYSDTYYINLERVAYLEEIRRKSTRTIPFPRIPGMFVWTVSIST